MNTSLLPLLEYGLEAANRLCNQAFADYLVPVQMPLAGLLAMVRTDSVDVSVSRVILRAGRPAGVALVARRGWTSRLAAMAVIPAARGQGLGEACMHQLLDEARARGERAMTLEVIAHNQPAVRLYQKCGFRTDRRLVGFSGRPEAQPDMPELEGVDVREAARALMAYGPPDHPWQMSGESLAQHGPPDAAYRGGAAYVVLSNPEAPTVAIRAVVTMPQARRHGQGLALLRAVFARHPGREWRVPALCPEEIGGLFEKAGLQRDNLSQWQMTIPL